ncbi:MAG: serine/threonine protein kinase [Deltaproteobacteria bacterium]|nr:serine/threonine protein kinase [Deltaproteobacteria bacterium]
MSGQSHQTNLVGQTLAGRYRLVSRLGAGGMGSVYKAHDSQMSDRVVAVKVLAPHLVSDEKQVLRFEQEARAANQLRHPNTISVLDFGRDPEGHIFMVIEFLTGETLTGILRHGRMDVSRVLYIFRQICKSLAEAHSKGIVHRDLKPDNIFVCEIYGESDFVKVIDFGIAKFLEEEGNQLTQAGKMFGTPRYLSPEQAQGKRLDARSDLYTLGVMLFECIAGRPPFIAEEAIAVAIKHVQEAPPKMEEVASDVHCPREVDHLVFKLLAKKPGDRYQSAEEVVRAIDDAMAALQRSGMGLPVGSYTPHAALTPARPQTIPPVSSDDEATRALDSLGSLGDDDATRAIDAVGGLGDDEATRAIDIPMPSAGVAAGGEATVALDTADALRGLEKARAQKAASAAPAAPTAAKGGGSGKLVGIVVGVLVLGAGAFGAMQLSKSGEPKGPAQPVVSEAEATRRAAEAARIAAEEAATKAAEAATRKAEAAAKKAAAEAAALAQKAAAAHKLTIDTTPPGATVLLDSLAVGKTPFELKLKAEDPDRVYLLKLEGFEDYPVTVKSRTLVEARIDRLPVELKRKEVAKPVAKPAGGGSKPKKERDWSF